jgi:hypothetical protein
VTGCCSAELARAGVTRPDKLDQGRPPESLDQGRAPENKVVALHDEESADILRDEAVPARGFDTDVAGHRLCRCSPGHEGPARCAGPGGDPPEPPRCAPRPAVVLRRHTGARRATRARLAVTARGDDPPYPPLRSAPRGGTSPAHRRSPGHEGPARSYRPGGRPPVPPAALRAPRGYFAGTPALAGPRGPGSLAGYDRLAVARCGSRRQLRRPRCLPASNLQP